MLIIWPNFNAAPRILDNLRTKSSIFEGLNMREFWDSEAEEVAVARRRDSFKAPKPRPAANPP